jgi:hypothetical protein
MSSSWVQQLLDAGFRLTTQQEIDDNLSLPVGSSYRAAPMPCSLRPLHFFVHDITLPQLVSRVNEWIACAGAIETSFDGCVCSWRVNFHDVDITLDVSVYQTNDASRFAVEVHGLNAGVNKFLVGEKYHEIRSIVLDIESQSPWSGCDPFPEEV